MRNDTKGFFATLFDFSFESFLTMKFLKIIYAILVGAILLLGLVFLVVNVASGEGVLVFAGLVLVPILTLLYLVLVRIGMESVALFFRIGENTQAMAESWAGRPPGAGGAPPQVAGGPGGQGGQGSPPAPGYGPPSPGSGAPPA